MMLNLEFTGKDFKNKTNAVLAYSILLPNIDPERSRRKMYSP